MAENIQVFFNLFSSRLLELEARQNYLIQKVGELHEHVTKLYALRCDYNDIPKATGHLRLQQLACLKLAEMVDTDLKAAGINYFLSAGNLLGACRTGDFVPWDDDIDFGLLRADFNRAVDLLTSKYNHGMLHTTWAKSGGIFKVLFLNKICLDLFPWDIHFKRLETPEEITNFKSDYRAAMDEARRLEQGKSKYADYYSIVKDMILHNEQPDFENGDIFEGIDWHLFPDRLLGHYHDARWRHEYILPFGEIEFCGYKFMAPNNPDAWLTTRYGDWKTLRPEFSRHTAQSFSYEELDLVKDFIDGKIK